MNWISDKRSPCIARTIRYSSALAVFLLLFGNWAIAQTPNFDNLRVQFEEGYVFESEFHHEYRDSYTGEETSQEGVIWIRRDHYRVEGDDQIMVVDGELSRVYDGRRNRLLISDYDEEEDDFAPSRMLQGVDDSYSITEESEGGETRIMMRSDDPFALFHTVEIRLNEDGLPVRIEAVDQVDNILITEFRGGQFLEADDRLFELAVPDDAERVDLRH